MACTNYLSIDTSLEQIYFCGNTACPDKQSFWFLLGLELARCSFAKVLFSSFPIHFLFHPYPLTIKTSYIWNLKKGSSLEKYLLLQV
jgi:hypothetical protein